MWTSYHSSSRGSALRWSSARKQPNRCGTERFGLCVVFSQHAMPEVVMNVIIPPPSLPPTHPSKKQKAEVVKTANFLKIQKRVFGKNSSSWKNLRNTANTSEFVQGHKDRAFKISRKSRLSENVPTAKCIANTSTSDCCDHKKAKNTKNPDGNWKRKNEQMIDSVKRKCCK